MKFSAQPGVVALYYPEKLWGYTIIIDNQHHWTPNQSPKASDAEFAMSIHVSAHNSRVAK